MLLVILHFFKNLQESLFFELPFSWKFIPLTRVTPRHYLFLFLHLLFLSSHTTFIHLIPYFVISSASPPASFPHLCPSFIRFLDFYICRPSTYVKLIPGWNQFHVIIISYQTRIWLVLINEFLTRQHATIGFSVTFKSIYGPRQNFLTISSESEKNIYLMSVIAEKKPQSEQKYINL